MEKLLSFFSSDSRPLYKADIYNAICLPSNYVVHFRYKRHNIDDELFKNLHLIKNQSGVIFFAKSHASESGRLTLQTENVSIRKISVIDYTNDDNTDLIHFYLQLREFADYKIVDSSSKIPPHLFVAELKLERGPLSRWTDRVNAVKDAFHSHLFIKIKLLNAKNKATIYPYYDVNENHCYYQLTDETEYIFDINFIHIDDITKSKTTFPVLQIEDKTKQIEIHVTDFIDVGINSDNRKIKFITKQINDHNMDSFVVFRIVNYDHINSKMREVLQSFAITNRIKKKGLSVFLFALNSTIAVSAVGFMGIFINSIKEEKIDYSNFIYALILTAVSSGMLYKIFNKK